MDLDVTTKGCMLIAGVNLCGGALKNCNPVTKNLIRCKWGFYVFFLLKVYTNVKKKSQEVFSLQQTTFILKGQHFNLLKKSIQNSNISYFQTNKAISFVTSGKEPPHSKYFNSS